VSALSCKFAEMFYQQHQMLTEDASKYRWGLRGE
jgi:hypothetical protein